MVRVVIVGQDPYPALGVADGLAFSAHAHSPIPASLRNIFKEYASDLNLPTPTSPDLTRWFEQGVLLLNRTLTTTTGERNAHSQEGWKELTFDIARALGGDKVVGVLWGRHAQELAPLFADSIQSAHPSPLSARRGFFGSKPFSQVNQMLIDRGEEPIDWQLS
jgi:uracil-DNA glycosylase